MGPSAQIHDRDDGDIDYLVERRLAKALGRDHPEYDDTDTAALRRKIREDIEKRSRTQAASNEGARR